MSDCKDAAGAAALPACEQCGGRGVKPQDGTDYVCGGCWGNGVQMDRNPSYCGQPGWKLHRCADGEQCRAEIPGGCATGWCAHFRLSAENLHTNIAGVEQPATGGAEIALAMAQASACRQFLRFNGDRASAAAIAQWANAFAEDAEGEPNASYITTDGSDEVDDLLLAVGDENVPVLPGDYVTREGDKFVLLRPHATTPEEHGQENDRG